MAPNSYLFYQVCDFVLEVECKTRS